MEGRFNDSSLLLSTDLMKPVHVCVSEVIGREGVRVVAKRHKPQVHLVIIPACTSSVNQALSLPPSECLGTSVCYKKHRKDAIYVHVHVGTHYTVKNGLYH